MGIKTNTIRSRSVGVMKLPLGTKVATVQREWNARDRVYIVLDRWAEGCLHVPGGVSDLRFFIGRCR